MVRVILPSYLKDSKPLFIAGCSAAECTGEILILALFDVVESVCIDADSSEWLGGRPVVAVDAKL